MERNAELGIMQSIFSVAARRKTLSRRSGGRLAATVR
jgi:hypothetical protein